MPSRPSSRAWSKSRTRARSSPRCFAAAKPGEQVVDLCAGAGGKTLALAAAMENKGQLYATDDDKRRLAPIHDAARARSGARNVQVRTPKSVGTELDDLAGRIDLVLIDAPCTGTGAWRRNPDAKWRVRPGALEVRGPRSRPRCSIAPCRLLKPGGRIAYVTCSVLDEENGAQVRAFIARHPEFSDRPAARGGAGDRAGATIVPRRRAGVRRRSVDDPAPHRHGRLLREPAAGARVKGFSRFRPNPGQFSPRNSGSSLLRFQELPPNVVATRDDRVRHDAPPFGPAEPARSLSSRFTGSVQFLGSFVGIPLALLGGYATYSSNFSVEAKCQSLRTSIVSMLDKKADPSTLRLLMQRDVAAFQRDCGEVDPDAVAAFKNLLIAERPPAARPAKVETR